MKKTLFVISLLAISLVACTQNPPKPVSDNFAKKFAGATKVKWGSEEANEWEAEFKLNGKEMSTSFDQTGKWLETEIEVGANELSLTVQNALKDQYAGYKITEASEIEKSDFKGFEIAIKKGRDHLEILIAPDGKIVSGKESEEVD